MTVYRQEIVEELQQYVNNHSFTELDFAMEEAIRLSAVAEQAATTWREIKSVMEGTGSYSRVALVKR